MLKWLKETRISYFDVTNQATELTVPPTLSFVCIIEPARSDVQSQCERKQYKVTRKEAVTLLF